MSILVVIPARYNSSRFPGKPLAKIKSKSGHKTTLIEMTWRAASKLKFDHKLVVATDDLRIEEECKRFDAEVIQTSKLCRNGTERVAETVSLIKEKFDVIINFQGDSPLLPLEYVELLVHEMKNKDTKVATPLIKMNKAMYNTAMRDKEMNLIGPTFAVCKKNLNALYFSKSIIPFSIGSKMQIRPEQFYFHVGLYAYSQDILDYYSKLEEGDLEKKEGLEQLRFLENDIDIKCVVAEDKGMPMWEVNNPTDIAIVEKIVKSGSL